MSKLSSKQIEKERQFFCWHNELFWGVLNLGLTPAVKMIVNYYSVTLIASYCSYISGQGKANNTCH